MLFCAFEFEMDFGPEYIDYVVANRKIQPVEIVDVKTSNFSDLCKNRSYTYAMQTSL